MNKIFSPTALSIYGITILFYAVVYMLLMVLPFQIIAQGQDHTAIGLIMGVTMLASMVCRPLAGRLIDKYGASPVFLFALIIFAISLLGYFIDSSIAYWAVRLIQGCVAACFSTAMEIITIKLLSSRLRAQGLSLYSLATVLPTTFGPALSLYLKDQFSIETIFMIFFAMGALNIIFALSLNKKTQVLDDINLEKKTGAFNEFIKSPLLVFPTLLMLLASIGNGATFTFLPLYLESISSNDATTYFLLQMITLVVVRFIGGRFLPSDGTISYASVIVLLLLMFFGCFLIYIHESLLLLSLAAIANGIAFALLYPLLLTFTSFHMHADYRGYYLGLFIGGADLGFALGAIMMGIVADMFALKIIFLLSASAVLIALPICYYLPRKGVLS
jgi:MFS family permease